MWYGFGRAIIECFRTDSLMIGPFKVSVLVSIIICVSAAITYFVIKNKRKVNVLAEGYEEIFADEEETVSAEEIEEIESKEEF